MDKPTTNWPSDSAICIRPDGSEARRSLEEMAAEALVVPDTKFPPDGEWHPENAALRKAAGASSALADFYREQQEIEIETRRYQETVKAKIPFGDAVALAERIKNLRLSPTFGGREDYIAFRAGRCLTLKEGQAAGEVYTAIARVVVKRPAQCAGCWEVTLAIPAALRRAGPDATFGVQTFQWLRKHAEPVARGFFIRRDGERFASAMYASESFGRPGFVFIIGLTPPDRDAVPVVPAPDEYTVAEYIERAASCPDHWDALAKAATVLLRSRQPLGEALGDWRADVLDGQTRRPNGQKAAKTPANTLRNHAIIEAVRALERCGWPATTFDREPGPACEVCARVFGLAPATVRNIWKER